ncbi:transposase [Aliikangiella sp. IMCC44359]|uniref:transposase n=1 Tax=Aliikangiella sp. IMCC44359 TaxID=3459125 RepID=UPI00403B175F
MAIPRKHIVDSHSAGFYHCISRCVRRAFLCGHDPFTGNNCDHRKIWLENRMLELAEVFAVKLYAYAIMDNHYHLVLYIDPKAPQNWTDEQVADKWILAYPGKSQFREARKQIILNDKEKLKKYRYRLGSLSWLMSRLNGPLAKQSNTEDFVKGRFWESRFTSIALLDETAVLSCMAYVDLNPIRAGIVEDLQSSLHTSIQKRISELSADITQLARPIQSVAGTLKTYPIQMTLTAYIQLVEWTGQSIIYPDKASMPIHINSLLNQMNLQPHHWLNQLTHLGRTNTYVIGSVERLKHKAQSLKKKWLKGIKAMRLLYSNE